MARVAISHRPTLHLLLLLLAAAGIKAAETSGDAPEAAVEGEKLLLLPPGETIFVDPRQISECWRSFMGVPGCSAELLRSFLTARLQLGPRCCELIDEVADSCFLRVFSGAPFSPFYPPAVRSYCAKVAAAIVPPPAA